MSTAQTSVIVQQTAAKPDAQEPVRVAVAGGGISGMAAALRLAQRGYAVTLYEAKPWLGGNMGSRRDRNTGTYHDVYPHMFSNFYVNFWDIVENELGLRRDLTPDSDFSPRNGIQTVTLAGGWRDLRNASGMDPMSMLRDMFSGISHMSPANMYLYLYSLVDLVAQRFEVRGLLGTSLNDYIRSRPCSTEEVAALHDAIVMFIWSVHSDDTSASSYKSFYRHAFGNTEPLLWLLKGSLAQKIIMPLEKRLLELGCKVHKKRQVHRVHIEGKRIVGLELRRTEYDEVTHKLTVTGDKVEAEPFDHLVLAVSPEGLGNLADDDRHANRRLSTLLPKLAHAAERLPAEPIAVLDLYLKRKLTGIPRENTMVLDSDCYFSIIDISQLWPELEKQDITVLTLAASDYWALPTDDERQNAFHMIVELSRYVGGFNPGKHWKDPDADIDWDRTSFRTNKDEPIFVNQAGSWDYRPETHMPEVDNLYFAGDFCRNHIDMATVEAAITSGINAAAAIQQVAPRGRPIVRLEPPVWSHASIAALKMVMAPAAYLAKAWLTAGDIARNAADPVRMKNLPHDVATLAGLPAAYAGDMAETAGSVVAGLASVVVRGQPGANAHGNHSIRWPSIATTSNRLFGGRA